MSEGRFDMEYVDGKLMLYDTVLDILFEPSDTYPKPQTGEPVTVYHDWYHDVVYEYHVSLGVLMKRVVALEVVEKLHGGGVPEAKGLKPGMLLPWSQTCQTVRVRM